MVGNNSLARHCAYCLELKPFKLCNGCHRRAYCSKECQRADWLPFGKGQGHKNYCKIEHGQEDVDWEVKPVPGKGLGIIAKRRIPARYRILIEGVLPSATSHPGIANLAPINAPLEKKFLLNSVAPPNSPLVVGLRYSRVNHSCSPNAALCHCSSTNAFILYACRDIEAGQEICRNYRFADETQMLAGKSDTTSIGFDLLVAKQTLAILGVTCPSDCVCSQQTYVRNFTRLRKLHGDFEQIKRTNSMQAFNILDEMMVLLLALNATCGTKAQIHLKALDVQTDDVTFRNGIAFGHMKKASEILSDICPLSAGTLKLEKDVRKLSLVF